MTDLRDRFMFEVGDTLEDDFATGEVTHRYWDIDNKIPLYRIEWDTGAHGVQTAINAQDELDEFHD